jgi:DNA-binding transcriptional LysR family regulator
MQFSIDLDICLPLPTYMPLIESVIKKFPESCFSLSNNTFVKCIERLEKKDCNVSIAGSHIRYPYVEYIPLPSIQMIPVASKAFYNQHKKQLNNPKNSMQYMQIMISDTQKELHQLNIEPLNDSMPKWMVGDMFTRKLLIVSGMGIGRLPDHLIAKELADGTLIQLDSKEYVSVTMEIYAMRLMNREHGVISNCIWQLLQNI